MEQEGDIIDSGLGELETNLTMLEIDFVSELNYLCRTFNVVLVSFWLQEGSMANVENDLNVLQNETTSLNYQIAEIVANLTEIQESLVSYYY